MRSSRENKKLAKRLRVIRKSELFDADWYLEQYPDVAESGMSPEMHYDTTGWKEGKDPSEYFSTSDYLEKYDDVRESGMNPLFHYEKFGKDEKREIKGKNLELSWMRYEFPSVFQKLRFYWENRRGKLLFRRQIQRNAGARILVCLHLYYMQSWPLIAEYLKNLAPYRYDLIVTYSEGHSDEETLAAVRAFKPDAQLICYPDRGFDIGPFLDALNSVDLGKYDIVFKLHSKAIKRAFIYIYEQIFKKKDWFFNLFNGLLTGYNVHRTVDKLLNDDGVGLVAAENLIVKDPAHKQFFTKQWAEKFCVDIRDDYHYVAGSCFALRAECLKPVQKLGLKIDDFAPAEPGVFSLAHGMERLVCACVETAGFTHSGNPTEHPKYSRECRRCAAVSAIRLLKDDRISLDPEFFYKRLELRKIGNYELVKIPLGEVRRSWNGQMLHLWDCHAYKYLQGDTSQYEAYVRENEQKYGWKMSRVRYDRLIEKLRSGFDAKSVPVLDSDNVLLDGQHRCCWLLNQYGRDYEIMALRLYFS